VYVGLTDAIGPDFLDVIQAFLLVADFAVRPPPGISLYSGQIEYCSS
jgi:hypothetical protein